jgi:hypothetical protein
MALMGYREYARHRKVTLRAVQKAIEAGRIKVTADKKIDSDQADRDWDANTDPAKQSLLYSAGPGHRNAAPQAEAGLASGAGAGADDPSAPASEDDTDDVDENNAAYREHRANRERIRAEREQIELDELKGSLIGVEEAKRLAFTAFRSLRDAVLNVPARIKDQCAAETDGFMVEQLIEAELTKALGGFDPTKVLRDSDDDDAD